MAWGSPEAACFNTDKAASDPWAGNLIKYSGATMPQSGDFAVATIALDNLSTGGGATNDVLTVTDARGNTWTKWGESSNSGAAAAACTVAIFTSLITTTLIDSDQMTIDFSGSVTAKAVVIFRVPITGGDAPQSDASPSIQQADGSDLGSGTYNVTHGSQSYLFVRGSAVEVEMTSMTPTASWTGQRAGTAGGGAASNMTAYLEVRVLTGTSATTDPTVTSGDNATILGAFFLTPLPYGRPYGLAGERQQSQLLAM